MAENHFERKLYRLRCDNGGEYIAKDFQNYAFENGIKLEFTIRYTPSQNGVAERMNRSLVEKARCLLKQSGLSNKF